jgi:hypothetical protein
MATPRRTDDPKAVTYRLSARARQLVEALAGHLAEVEERPVSATEVIERAIRRLARQQHIATR